MYGPPFWQASSPNIFNIKQLSHLKYHLQIIYNSNTRCIKNGLYIDLKYRDNIFPIFFVNTATITIQLFEYALPNIRTYVCVGIRMCLTKITALQE